tara:strand:- start:1272 stop:1658 length:387 start_codon:yes stop_codon:yes gene_type:complete
MPIISIPFNDPINISVQVRDIVYAIPVSLAGSAANSFKKENLSQALEIGWVWRINNQEGLDPNIIPSLDVVQTSGNVPTSGDFIMFSKSKAVNTSGILGYYAEVTLKNYSLKDIELFSVGTGIAISSN